jgi:type II pantothenate kinase
MIIGIDIGSTTTKAVAIQDKEVVKKLKTKAMDAVTSATGALGKMILEESITLQDIEKIIITGVGSSSISSDIFGIPTQKIDEITAIGVGGMYLAKQENIIIANIGTGTAIIEANREKIVHYGGSGVGGGTIVGLSKQMLGIENMETIVELAALGDLGKVDLLIEDITDKNLSFLNRETTAANFGKMLETSGKSDIALGILNMVYQVIGVLSVFAARNKHITKVVITGNGSNNPIGKDVLSRITEMYGITFEYPKDAEYATAIGAGFSG